MKKIIIPTILVLLSAAVVYMFIAYKPGVKPVYYQSFPQITQTVSPPSQRIVETLGYDYSTNMVVANLLSLTPTTVSYNLISKDIGQLYYDKVSEDLRFNDGNYPAGIKFVFGKFADDVISITPASDTVNFPPLRDNYAFGVVYHVAYDSINADSCTIRFQETYNADSTYLDLSSVYPYSLPQVPTTIDFTQAVALKYQRAIIDYGGTDIATIGTASVSREINVLP